MTHDPLIAYIEYNLIKAKMVEKLGEYLYSSYRAFSEQDKAIECLKASFVFEQYHDSKERLAFIEHAHDERVLEEIKKASNLVVTTIKEKKPDLKKLQIKLAKAENLKERNQVIFEANSEGVSQHRLSTIAGISQTQIARIIKKYRG